MGSSQNKEFKRYTMFIIFGLVSVIVISAILFFISSKTYTPQSSLGSSSSELCGNGILDEGEICDYSAKDGENNPYGDLCNPFCGVSGTYGGWEGCRGTGISVCLEHENVTEQYYIDHSSCIKNTNCRGQFYACNEVLCPEP